MSKVRVRDRQKLVKLAAIAPNTLNAFDQRTADQPSKNELKTEKLLKKTKNLYKI